jgi:Ser/Thr protein kinase RdoA (MazF antagonist)
LPEALVHPDLVLGNVVASPTQGLVIVDWAGTGRSARLWSLGYLLFSEGAKDLRRVDRVVAGYQRYVQPEPEEFARLPALARIRPLTLQVWSYCVGRKPVVEAAAAVASDRELAEAVASRAMAAFAD